MSGDVIALVRGTRSATARDQSAAIVAWAKDEGRRVLRTVAPTAEEIGAALYDMRTGAVVGLVVAELTAVGSVVSQEALRALAASVGGQLFAVRPEDADPLGDDTDDDLRLLLREYETQRGRLAAQERKTQLHRGAERARAEGRRAGGRAQFGWRTVAGELVEVARDQAARARLIELRARGMGYAPIARQMTTEGYLTQDGNATWHAGTVKKIVDRIEHGENGA